MMRRASGFGETPRQRQGCFLRRNEFLCYFGFFGDDLAADKNRSIPKADRKAYLAADSRPGRMQSSWKYFATWPQTAKDFAQMSKTRLTMPVLSIGGDKSLGQVLAEQMKLVAPDVTTVIVKNSGHWINALLKFL
jgi:pimeloyl-ACP methyl ester carboxylesterase